MAVGAVGRGDKPLPVAPTDRARTRRFHLSRRASNPASDAVMPRGCRARPGTYAALIAAMRDRPTSAQWPPRDRMLDDSARRGPTWGESTWGLYIHPVLPHDEP